MRGATAAAAAAAQLLACTLLVDTTGLSSTGAANIGEAGTSSTDSSSGNDASPIDAADADRVITDGYYSVVIEDRPIAYYRLDEAAGPLAINSGKGGDKYVGTFLGDVAFSKPGAVVDNNRAVRLQSGGRVDCGKAFDFSGRSSFTMEAWVNTVVEDVYHTILAQDLRDNQGRILSGIVWVHNANTKDVAFLRKLTSGQDENLTITIDQADVFNHLVVTYDANVLRGFLNGLEVAQRASTLSLPPPTTSFQIGVDDRVSSPFNGVVDEVAIYDYALSSARVLKHYQVGHR